MKTIQAEIKNRKGNTLRGIVTLPGEGRYPAVLNLHGFGGNMSGYKALHVSMARELAAAGIGCVRFDFYGNGESDGVIGGHGGPLALDGGPALGR